MFCCGGKVRFETKLQLIDEKSEFEEKNGRLKPDKFSKDFFYSIYYLLLFTMILGALIVTKLLLEIVWIETPNFIL